MLVKPGIQTKTVSALSDNVFDGVLDISDLRSASIQVSGTFSLTLLVEVSNDLGENPDTWDTIETITTPGMYPIALSYRSLRLRCSSYASGSADLSAIFSKEQPIVMNVDVPAPSAPEGGATEATLSSISTKVDGLTTPADTQPVSIAALPALPSGNNNIGDVDILTLPTDASSATTVDATALGDTTIVSITNSPRLYYICLSADGANTADVRVVVRIGASQKYTLSLKPGVIWARNIGAGRKYITGSTGDDIIVNLSAAQTVHVSVEYADI